jgi:hypothetical protein
MRASDTLPAAISTEIEYLSRAEWWVEESDRPIINQLSDKNLYKVWHRLSKISPESNRPALIGEWVGLNIKIFPEERQEALWDLAYDGDIESVVPLKEWTDKELALQLALYYIFEHAKSGATTVSHADLKPEIDSCRKQAARLRKEAERFREYRDGRVQPVLPDEAEGHAQAIERAAAWCETRANDTLVKFEIGGLLVRHHQGSPRARAFVIELSETLLRIYGKELRGTIVDITNAVLGTTITAANVRYWLNEYRNLPDPGLYPDRLF